MLITYRALRELLYQKYAEKSLQGVIDDFSEYFDESLATAEQIEDYEYLSTFIENRKDIEEKYRFFWNYKQCSVPTMVEKHDYYTVDALSVIAYDHPDIDVRHFEQLIEEIATRDKHDLEQWLGRFRSLYKARVNIGNAIRSYKLGYIGRNDLCYCGSGKKYKKCHGFNN